MISYYTKVHLSMCNSSWVISTQQTVNFDIQTAAMFVFFVFDKNGLINSCSSFEDLSVHKISWSHVDWCKFCIQKFERLPFWNVWRYGIKKYGVKVTFNGMTSLLNFIKIYQLVPNLFVGTHRQKDR
jgi:hypothetical protein